MSTPSIEDVAEFIYASFPSNTIPWRDVVAGMPQASCLSIVAHFRQRAAELHERIGAPVDGEPDPSYTPPQTITLSRDPENGKWRLDFCGANHESTGWFDDIDEALRGMRCLMIP